MYSTSNETQCFKVFSVQINKTGHASKRQKYEITTPFTDHMLRTEEQKAGLGKRSTLQRFKSLV